jgi:hypothetical protein
MDFIKDVKYGDLVLMANGSVGIKADSEPHDTVARYIIAVGGEGETPKDWDGVVGRYDHDGHLINREIADVENYDLLRTITVDEYKAILPSIITPPSKPDLRV